MDLTPHQQHALNVLHAATHTDIPVIHPTDIGANSRITILKSLHARKLARPIEHGLWRITLAGLNHARNQP